MDHLLGVLEAGDIVEQDGGLRARGLPLLFGRRWADPGELHHAVLGQHLGERLFQCAQSLDHAALSGLIQAAHGQFALPFVEGQGADLDQGLVGQGAGLHDRLELGERLGPLAGGGELLGEQEAQAVVVGPERQRLAERVDSVGGHARPRCRIFRTTQGPIQE